MVLVNRVNAFCIDNKKNPISFLLAISSCPIPFCITVYVHLVLCEEEFDSIVVRQEALFRDLPVRNALFLLEVTNVELWNIARDNLCRNVILRNFEH